MNRILLFLALMLAPMPQNVTVDRQLAFNIASGAASTIAAPPSTSGTTKVYSIALTGTTATTSNLVQGTTVTITSNGVSKGTYIIGTQPLFLSAQWLFQSEPGQAISIACGTGTCAGTVNYIQ